MVVRGQRYAYSLVYSMEVCNSLWIIAKIKTREMSVWAKFAKISSRENFYLYSIYPLCSLLFWNLGFGALVQNKWFKTPKFMKQGFSLGGTGGSPHRRKFWQSPHPRLVPVLGPRFVSPPPAEARPQKFEKFKYIFGSNLTTFKLKSTL